VPEPHISLPAIEHPPDGFTSAQDWWESVTHGMPDDFAAKFAWSLARKAAEAPTIDPDDPPAVAEGLLRAQARADGYYGVMHRAMSFLFDADPMETKEEMMKRIEKAGNVLHEALYPDG